MKDAAFIKNCMYVFLFRIHNIHPSWNITLKYISDFHTISLISSVRKQLVLYTSSKNFIDSCALFHEHSHILTLTPICDSLICSILLDMYDSKIGKKVCVKQFIAANPTITTIKLYVIRWGSKLQLHYDTTTMLNMGEHSITTFYQPRNPANPNKLAWPSQGYRFARFVYIQLHFVRTEEFLKISNFALLPHLT